MLGLFGKKMDHPLADLKTAQQVLSELPKTDSIGVVQEISSWIESIHELADDFRLDHELAVLRLFDDAAQLHVRKLLRDYFTEQPLTKFQESRLWTVLDNHFAQTELVYYDILTRYNNEGRGAANIRPELAFVCARGIANLAYRFKMIAARYALVNQALWQHLSEYYLTAEGARCASDDVPMYPGIPGSTTVEKELAALMLWYGLAAGVQSPVQVHVVERLVFHARKSLRIDNRYNASAHFVFDLKQPTPPMRVAGDSTLHAGLRFSLLEDPRQIFDHLTKNFEKGIIPDDFDLMGGRYDTEMLGEATKRLVETLSQPAPMRRTPRRKICVNLSVASGFNKVLEQAESGLSLFSSDTPEVWEVEDISTTGYRIVVSNTRTEGIKIGSLIGSKPENVSHWGAGIVRRLSLDDKSLLHIGVEVLSPQIAAISLQDTVRSVNTEGQVAIHLNRPADTSGEAWLLMKPTTFSLNRSMAAEMSGRKVMLIPVALVESSDDYDLARFRCIEQNQPV